MELFNWISDLLSVSLSQVLTVIVVHLPIMLPLVLVWLMFAFNILSNVGIQYFITESQEFAKAPRNFGRRILESPSMWMQFWSGCYAWMAMATGVFLSSDLIERFRLDKTVEFFPSKFIASGALFLTTITLISFCINIWKRKRDTVRDDAIATEKSGKGGELFRAFLGALLSAVVGLTIVAFIQAKMPYTYALELSIFYKVGLIVGALYITLLVLRALRPIAVPYLFLGFFTFLAVYYLLGNASDNYRMHAVIGFVIWIVAVFCFRRYVMQQEMTFDGLPSKEAVAAMGPQLEINARTPNKNLLPIFNADQSKIIGPLKEWHSAAVKAQKLSKGQKPKMILMGTSGGAALAAYWTTIIADRLAEADNSGDLPGGFHAIRAISGASGGMVGAGYVAGRAAFAAQADAERNDGKRTCVTDITKTMDDDSLVPAPPPKPLIVPRWFRPQQIKRDLLTQLFAQMFSGDFMQVLLPFVPASFDADRGKTLERQFNKMGFSENPTFGALRPYEEKGQIPSLIFTPTLLETGVPMFISNLNLSEIIDEEERAVNSVAMFNLFPEAYKTFSIKTAARMSATFPYVSPAVSLPLTDRSRRVVDAGYYENYGVHVLCQFLMHPTVRQWIIQNTSGVALLELRAFPNAQAGTAKVFKQAFQFITSPFEGLLAARGSSQLLRNSQLVRMVQRAYEGEMDRKRKTPANQGFVRSFELVNQEQGMPLNWYVPQHCIDSLCNQATGRNQAELERDMQETEDNVNSEEQVLAHKVLARLLRDWSAVWGKPKQKA